VSFGQAGRRGIADLSKTLATPPARSAGSRPAAPSFRSAQCPHAP